jgi:hypothetical protein
MRFIRVRKLASVIATGLKSILTIWILSKKMDWCFRAGARMEEEWRFWNYQVASSFSRPNSTVNLKAALEYLAQNTTVSLKRALTGN